MQALFWKLICLVWVQLPLAFLGGHAFRYQLKRIGRPQDYTFWQHPAWVIDTALTCFVYWIVPRYQFDWTSTASNATQALATVITLGAIEFWRRGGVVTGDYLSSGGGISVASLPHGVFMWVMIELCLQFFCGLVRPLPKTADLFIVGAFCVVFFPLGVVKFSRSWRPDAMAYGQTVAILALVGAAMFLRYRHDGWQS
jgi:hypothetical protein